MKNVALLFLVVAFAGPVASAQQKPSTPDAADAVRQRIRAYAEAFNKNDPATVAAFWAQDAVSVNDETGERTMGRKALEEDFATFFAENPGARLTGNVGNVHMIRPEVASVDGEITLSTSDSDPTRSAYTAVLVKSGDQWLISSSHERELPSPPTPYEALKELEWLVGVWQDKSDGARVTTTVRWSPNRAFLIRSYNAQTGDGEGFDGTQVIGWDPVNNQIRTWTFNSDGSFGEGAASKSGEEWLVKMTHVLSDGRLAGATQVITRVDDDTLRFQKIGESIDGQPMPASEPITVVRVGDATAVSAAPGAESAGGTP